MELRIPNETFVEILAQKYGFGLDKDGNVDIKIEVLDIDDFISLFNRFSDEEEYNMRLYKINDNTVEYRCYNGSNRQFSLSEIKNIIG